MQELGIGHPGGAAATQTTAAKLGACFGRLQRAQRACSSWPCASTLYAMVACRGKLWSHVSSRLGRVAANPAKADWLGAKPLQPGRAARWQRQLTSRHPLPHMGCAPPPLTAPHGQCPPQCWLPSARCSRAGAAAGRVIAGLAGCACLSVPCHPARKLRRSCARHPSQAACKRQCC